ncbi:MAG: hypothetical protein AAF438_00425 [Pseudomonadota bacterium]
MRGLSWKAIFLVSIGVAFAVAVLATFADWWKNPAGIFHDDTGTHWPIVWETAISWFMPVFLVLVTILIVWLLVLRRK